MAKVKVYIEENVETLVTVEMDDDLVRDYGDGSDTTSDYDFDVFWQALNDEINVGNYDVVEETDRSLTNYYLK